jgi:ATP-dependent DNA helicase RecG
MIARSREAGLPEPDFEQRGGQWVVTLWRDWLTEQMISELGLSERQKLAVVYTKTHRRITSGEYQNLAGVSRQTALRDLNELVRKSVISRRGEKRGVYYEIKGGMPRK